jgi:putative transposase
MPWGLKRFHESRQLHFLTFSCYHRKANFGRPDTRDTFLGALERVRKRFGLCIYGYVVMPEHVHLLVNEPEHSTLAQAMQSLKRASRGHWHCERQTRFGRPGTTTLMSGANGSLWRSSDIYIGIP